jgi:hypothetical protein
MALAALAGCTASDWSAPGEPTDLALGSAAQGRAGYLLEVDMRRRAVRVAAPIESQRAQSGLGPSFSILDGQSIGLTVDNYEVSELGQYSPGKVRVRFDVSVANRLPGLTLAPAALGEPRTSLMLFSDAARRQADERHHRHQRGRVDRHTRARSASPCGRLSAPDGLRPASPAASKEVAPPPRLG